MKVLENYSLLAHNTFGIDVRCRRFAEYDSPDELKMFLNENESDAHFLHIGEGSNLLFLKDFEGTILRSNIRSIEMLEDDKDYYALLRVGAAVVWDELVDYTLSHGLYGLENLSLIPGTVGAAAVQNIGAYGVEVKDFITRVECMNLRTGELRSFSKEECQYGYRSSFFKLPENWGQWAVLYVTLRLNKTFTPHLEYKGLRTEIEKRSMSMDALTADVMRNLVIEVRRNKLPDPKVEGNAGSFFKNPVISRQQFESLLLTYPEMPHYDVDAEHIKVPAAWLIEQCGWKGKSLGRAGVHALQPLVLVNRGGAAGVDIQRLSEAIQHDVKQKFDIEINPEVNFIF